MRLNVHDFSGHPFQAQLSRQLAARGHEVEHTYCSDYVTGRGVLELTEDDPTTLRFSALSAGVVFRKYSPITRMVFELSYARAWQRHLDRSDFDAIVVCNVPLFSIAATLRHLRQRGLPWVLWHQDIYSRAVNNEVERRLYRLAPPVTRVVESLEKSQVRNASHVVAISEAFVAQYQEWHLRTDRVTVIPNWAPLNEIRPMQRDNPWSSAKALPARGLRLLYSGTLGRKHNPSLLLQLLDNVTALGVSASLVVCSEGPGARSIVDLAGHREDVRVLGFQPAAELSAMLSSGDIMVALLEPHASAFSVPSKVLSYLSAGRPIVALMPRENPAAAHVREAGGFVAAPDSQGVQEAAAWVLAQTQEDLALARLGEQARRFAELNFDIQSVTDQFEGILTAARVAQTSRRGEPFVTSRPSQGKT